MADAPLPTGNSLVETILGLAIAVLTYFLRKRDKKIDELETADVAQTQALTALRTEMMKEYATNDSVIQLFQTTATQNKESLDRVHKRIDEGNEDRREMRDDIKEILRAMPRAN
jgi:hypothetical protein